MLKYLSTSLPPRHAPVYESVPKITDFSNLLSYCKTAYYSKIAFETSDAQISFTDFSLRTHQLADYLSQTYHHKHLAIISENSLDFLLFFFAIVLSGNVAVVIDKDETPEKISEMSKTADVTAVFTSQNRYPHLSIIPQIGKKVKLMSVILNAATTKRQTSEAPIDQQSSVVPTTQHPQVPPEKHESSLSPDRPAVIFFTSGTTGPNKAVLLSQKNICANIYAAASLYRPHGNTISFLPFHHAFGLVTAILMPFYYGCTTYICSSLKSISPTLAAHTTDTIFAVPAVIELFQRQIFRTARKSHSLGKLKFALTFSKFLPPFRRLLFSKVLRNLAKTRVIICGGAYLSQKYINFFHLLGIKILNGYGITECSPVVAVNRTQYSRRNSVGQVCRNTELKIENDEILIKSNYVMLEYYNNPAATASAFDSSHTWFHTGDLGYIDDDGFLFITGRKKDLIILSNGENISPESIESTFLQDESVEECQVYAESGKLYLEIYPTESYLENQPHFDQMLYNYNQKQPRNHQLVAVKLRSTEFPKNNNHKIIRKGNYEQN